MFKNILNFLRDVFFLYINIDCEFINIFVLKLKLYIYKLKFKSKRGDVKEYFENEYFIVLIYIVVFLEGKFKKFEYLVYKEMCEKLVLEFNEVKK